MAAVRESAERQGFDPDRLERIAERVKKDIGAEQYDGCEMVVARRGEIVFEGAFGYADRAAGRAVESQQPFYTMSVGKQFTVATVLQRIEAGEMSLTTRVADLIPGFGARGKDRITVGQVLTHRSGLMSMLPPLPPEQLGNLEAVVAAVCASLPESTPGTRINYCVIVGHAILAELVRRCDGGTRPYRQIVKEDLFEPLGMKQTCMGLRADLAGRVAPVVARDRRSGVFEPELVEFFGAAIDENAEIPAGGYVSTAQDLHRFAEMLRRGGELDGTRILSPLMIERARKNHTGDEPNSLWDYAVGMRGWDPFPANLGLGFFLRGTGMHPTPFGTLASPETFGGIGAGSTTFWVDPEREITFAFLSAGLLEDSYSVDRNQYLADMVFSSLKTP